MTIEASQHSCLGLFCAIGLLVAVTTCRNVTQPTPTTQPVASAGQPAGSVSTPVRQAWPEDAELEKVAKECPVLRPVIDKMREEHFEEAIELARAIPRDTACGSKASELQNSTLMTIGREWQLSKTYDRSPTDPRLGFDFSPLYDRYRRLLKVAQSSTPFGEPARRLLVPDGLDFWLLLARQQCSYLGVAGPCIEAEKAILAVAPNSEQAKAVAEILEQERRIDLEMMPLYNKARGIILRRARRCEQINKHGCFAHEHRLPDPEPDLEDEPSTTIPEDASLDQVLEARAGCPSWWDKSPATLRINAEWHALLARIPYKGRRQYLAREWVYAANSCRDSLSIPWEKSVTK